MALRLLMEERTNILVQIKDTVYENDLECKKAKGETVYETIGTFTHLNILYKHIGSLVNV